MMFGMMPAWKALLRSAEGGSGAAGAAGQEAAAPGAVAAGAEAGAGGATGEWLADQRISEEQRSWLSAKGINATDPTDAVTRLIGIGQAADRRFGKPLDSVIDRPAKDQSLADWRRANGEVFGLPQNADGYEIKRPDGLPEGIAWSDDLAGRMKTLAFERGLAPDDVTAMTGMYADYVAGVNQQIDQEMASAETRLKADLQKIWGRDADANTAKARTAASALAEAAGLDQDGISAVVGLLSDGKPGETLALRMFAALGDMMGEDRAIGLKAGVGSLGMNKAEAEAAFGRFTAPDGEWAKAALANDSEAIARLRPQYERLARQASGAK